MGWYRYPKTSQEIRNYSRWSDVPVKIRSKRNPANLPDSWTDIPRTIERSWKAHRRTQYKVLDKYYKRRKDSSKYAEHMARRGKHVECRYIHTACPACKKLLLEKFWKLENQRKEERRLRELEIINKIRPVYGGVVKTHHSN